MLFFYFNNINIYNNHSLIIKTVENMQGSLIADSLK